MRIEFARVWLRLGLVRMDQSLLLITSLGNRRGDLPWDGSPPP